MPSSSVGNNKTWLEQADKVILEVNRWQPAALEGMHDIYYGTALPPNRKPIPLTHPDDRIGEPYLHVRPGQGRRGRRDRRPRPQLPVQPAGRRPRSRSPATCWTSSTTRSSAAG